jgi:hypothetical protein
LPAAETLTGEVKMKFMLILKASKDSEAGKMPSEEVISAMVKYNQEQAKAGVLLDAAGLYPSSTGARVNVSAEGKKTVVDGPFTESKELVAGYWLIQVKSIEEAIEWAKRAPIVAGQETQIEVRQFIEFEG